MNELKKVNRKKGIFCCNQVLFSEGKYVKKRIFYVFSQALNPLIPLVLVAIIF